MDTFVTHNQLLIILILVFIGASIFAYAMLKHAVELRNITTNIIEDLTVVQGFIDVELAAKLLEQQAAITLISDVQQAQGVNLANLNTNSGITADNFETIRTATGFTPGNSGNVTLNGWQFFPII